MNLLSTSNLYTDKFESVLKKIGWIILLCIIVLEYLLFRHYMLQEIAPYYPFAFDQSGYISTVYQLYENFIKQGVIHTLLTTPVRAIGILFPIQSALYLVVTSPTRFNLLTLNFIYFALLQLTLFLTARKIFDKTYIGFLAIGLLLAVQTPFFRIGGIDDFRIILILCWVTSVYLIKAINILNPVSYRISS